MPLSQLNENVWKLPKGEERRQAIAPLRGYIYQLHVSLAAWMKLAPGELLQLEVAEDYSVIAQNAPPQENSLRAVQVKETAKSGRVTLNSSGVKKAIMSLWNLQQANPGRQVHMTYLTTSEIGNEQDDPLTSGIPGIQAWTDAALGQGNLQSLRNALIYRFSSGELGTFLQASKDAELVDQFISKLTFACGQPDSSAIEEREKKALILRRQEVDSTEDAAAKAYDILLGNILRTVIYSTDRILDADDFLSCFRKATESKLGSQTLQDLLRHLVSLPTGLTLEQASADALISSQALATWPRDIKKQHIARPELDALLLRISEKPNGRTLVIGDAGTGKSALFAELTHKLQENGHAVFAIKADFLSMSVANLVDLTTELGCKAPIEDEIELLASTGPVVILIDQLDAVSEIMDFKSERMSALLQLVNRFSHQDRQHLPVHVLVSSRPFEAAHDARFEVLKAKAINLKLPPVASVRTILSALSLSDALPPEVLETSRRPFALKLYVDIVSPGDNSLDFAESSLLDKWLTVAKLGSVEERETVMRFLKHLAGDMTEAEDLWLSIDHYAEDERAINLTIAAGLIVRRDEKIGFSHQSWLDDFQAKAFATPEAICTYAWLRQDGLFSRASVLRGLQRLRRSNVSAYQKAISKLLFDSKTRRHLKHLIVDIVSNQTSPLAFEISLMHQLIEDDLALARRGLFNMRTHWEAWRKDILPFLPFIMTEPDLRWTAILLLVSEAEIDRDGVLRIISLNWPTKERDLDVFQVFWRSALWSPQVIARLRQIFDMPAFEGIELDSYVSKLADTGRATDAIDLVGLFLEVGSIASGVRLAVYGLDTLAEQIPLHFSQTILMWFTRQASAEIKEGNRYRLSYPRLNERGWDWDHDDRPDGLYAGLRHSLNRSAQEDPEKFLGLISQYFSVEIDQVQSLLMEGLASGAHALASHALDLLLSDPRRLYCGSAYRTDTRNVGHLIQGWSSQLLIEAIVPHLERSELKRLAEYIEGWNLYATEAARNEEEPSTRLNRIQWADEHRLELLDKLPDGILSSRRQRQLNEWRLKQPQFTSKTRHIGMLQVVGSPMGADKMGKASNADIFKLLDELNDQSDERTSRRLSRSGGVSQLSEAFGQFAKSHPSRAADIARTRFAAGRHENAAGELVRQLTEVENVDVELVIDLVHELDSKGFSSKAWRTNAAWALRSVAKKATGLSDVDIERLESWFLVDPDEVIKLRIKRENLDRANAQRNDRQEKKIRSLIFGDRQGGIIPQGNFTVMDALHAGFLCREPQDSIGWLNALMRHVNQPEDPANWVAFLKFRAIDLFHHPDRNKVQEFFGKLFEKHPDILILKRSVPTFWGLRPLFPDQILTDLVRLWRGSEDSIFQQAAGEYAAGMEIVGENSEGSTLVLQDILTIGSSSALTGVLLVYAKAWQEPDFHIKATALLAQFAPNATLEQAQAIATAFIGETERLPKAATLMEAIVQNPIALKQCCVPNFFEQIQLLSLNSRHAHLVMNICEKIFALDSARRQETGRASASRHLVSTMIALQRTEGAIRSRAMDLYEALLDAGSSDAEQAAVAALRRAGS